jgi:hypothetical protein
MCNSMNRLRAIQSTSGFAAHSVLVVLAFLLAASAQAVPMLAKVRSITGTATYSTNGGPAQPLKVGNTFSSGTTIKTGPASSVDLSMDRAGLIRITENTILQLDKLSASETGADTAVDVEVGLPDGDMYFDVNKMSKGSRYEIKMPTGVAGIRGTKGRFSFRPAGSLRPPVVLLTGSVIFVHRPPNAPVSTFLITTPPAAYFSATEGVKVAPQSLIDEVDLTLKELGSKVRNLGDEGEGRGIKRRQTPPEPFISPGG